MNRHRGSRVVPDGSRRRKALGLLPIALLSATWTVSLSTAGDAATASRVSDTGNADVPGRDVTIPDEPIAVPASVPAAGAIAPSVPTGTADSVVAAADAWGIPAPALTAYQRAAQIIDGSDTGCHLPWGLLAAIGRVESDHGRYGGSRITAQGLSVPGILGPRLDGRHGTRALSDTDAGELDGDPAFDRAVGPMQFVPSTWSAVKVDADGDGVRNPQDLDDAALASAVYLCSGPQDLATNAGRQDAVFRYNHSAQYVQLVLALMDAYSQGSYTAVPAGTWSGTVLAPAAKPAAKPAKSGSAPATKPAKPVSSGGSHPGPAQPAPSATPSKAAPGLASTVKQVVQNPTAAAGAVPQVLTRAQATVVCLQHGLSTLDLAALTRCVSELLG